MKKLFGKREAFTLVEILVVVAEIGILFVAFVPRIDFAGEKALET
jgi:competence protein ComGC